MRDRATLALTELCVLLLVFSMAAALCLKAFVWSAERVRENRQLALAAILAQNEAERLKSCRSAAAEMREFDADGNPTDDGGCYRLTVAPESGGLLSGAEITVADGEGRELCRLTVLWQEVCA